MIRLGKTARHLREKLGLTQRAAAERLGISYVHLCNVENDKATPSPELVEKYQQIWEVDLHVLAWCLYGDVKKLPISLRRPMMELAKAWREQLGRIASKDDGSTSGVCSVSGN